MRNIISKILKEESERVNNLYHMIMDHMLKNYTNLPSDGDPLRDFVQYQQWANGVVAKDLRVVFGITEENDPELFNSIKDEYLSRVTGLIKKGTRVKLIRMEDPYTKLKSGDEGTIVGYNHTPWGVAYMMQWDNGSSLDLVPEEDEFEVLS